VLSQLAEEAGEMFVFDEIFFTRPCLKLAFAAIFFLWRVFKRCCSALRARENLICQNCFALFKQKMVFRRVLCGAAADGSICVARLRLGGGFLM